MAQYVTKNQLGDFTEKLLSNDKKIRDELKNEIANLPSGGGSYDKEVMIHFTEAICKLLQQVH